MFFQSKHIRIAQKMLNAFNKYKISYPNASKEKCLRYSIESINKTIEQSKIDSWLKYSIYLGDIAGFVVENEIPDIIYIEEVQYDMNVDLYNFFMKQAPSEVGNIKDVIEICSIQMGKKKANYNAIGGLINDEYYEFKCIECGNNTMINKPLRLDIYRCKNCKLPLIDLTDLKIPL